MIFELKKKKSKILFWLNFFFFVSKGKNMKNTNPANKLRNLCFRSVKP